MKRILYNIIAFISKHLGSWVLRVFVWFVATGYFFFFPNRVASSKYFYSNLYTQKSGLYHLWCVWKQYHSFARVFVDRFEYTHFENISYVTEGEDYLEEALSNKRGGIILMSHLGNWEIAAHILKQKYKDLPLLLFMGSRNKEQIEKLQKKSLKERGVQVLAAEEGEEDPYDIIQGVRFLRAGGIVSMTGDVLWHREQRSVETKFLNHSVRVAEVPHYLALITGVPLFVLFSFRIDKSKYSFSVSEPFYLSAETKAQKIQMVQESAQMYASLLEEKIKAHPFQWYHFKPFLGSKLS